MLKHLKYLKTFVEEDIKLTDGSVLFMKNGTDVDDEVYFNIYKNQDRLGSI